MIVASLRAKTLLPEPLVPISVAAAAEMVHVERTIEPDRERHERYAFFVDRYAELYPAVKDVMGQVTRHVAGGDPA